MQKNQDFANMTDFVLETSQNGKNQLYLQNSKGRAPKSLSECSFTIENFAFGRNSKMPLLGHRLNFDHLLYQTPISDDQIF